MSRIAAVLEQAGLTVSEERFAALVQHALSELGAPGAADPAGALAAEEVAALTAVKADLSPRRRREPDPRAGTAAAYAAVLADSLSVAEVARQLGIDGSRVRHRLAQRALIGIRRSSGWLLPAYQFDEHGRVLPGLERVVRALPSGLHPLVVARFFATVSPDLALDRRPLSPRQWLASGGDPAAVTALAATLDLLP